MMPTKEYLNSLDGSVLFYNALYDYSGPVLMLIEIVIITSFDQFLNLNKLTPLKYINNFYDQIFIIFWYFYTII